MKVHVLLYESGTDSEGIHSLEMNGNTVVLMFEDNEDAERYCGLLEAQDFPRPCVEAINLFEIEEFCNQSGYVAKLVKTGFIPKTKEDRVYLVPPEGNLDVSKWKESSKDDILNSKKLQDETDSKINDELSDIRKRLEGLL